MCYYIQLEKGEILPKKGMKRMSIVQIWDNIVRIANMPRVELIYFNTYRVDNSIDGIKYTVVINADTIAEDAFKPVFKALEELREKTFSNWEAEGINPGSMLPLFQFSVRTRGEIRGAIERHDKDITEELLGATIVYEDSTYYSDTIACYNRKHSRS